VEISHVAGAIACLAIGVWAATASRRARPDVPAAPSAASSVTTRRDSLHNRPPGGASAVPAPPSGLPTGSERVRSCLAVFHGWFEPWTAGEALALASGWVAGVLRALVEHGEADTDVDDDGRRWYRLHDDVRAAGRQALDASGHADFIRTQLARTLARRASADPVPARPYVDDLAFDVAAAIGWAAHIGDTALADQLRAVARQLARAHRHS
jgi:hypothetical protein